MWNPLIMLLFLFHVIKCDELVVLNTPTSAKLSSAKEVSVADLQSLPYQLFGLDESQSRVLSDVSFFRRPSLLALVSLTCDAGGGSACANAVAAAKPPARRMRLAGTDTGGSAASEPLLFQPASGGSLAEAAAAARLDQALLASSASLPDSSHPALFAGLDLASADRLPAALPYETGLPTGLVRQMRLAKALVASAVASGLLADSQPDALQLDLALSAAEAADPEVRRRVAEFVVAGLADQLAEAAGHGRAFVAVAVSEAPPPALVRVGRSLMAAADSTAAPPPVTTPAPSGGMNLAPDYNADFPVMFNLILWLSVVLALAVYAVAYGLWNVDPGKDSIIYRRGYAHAKKD